MKIDKDDLETMLTIAKGNRDKQTVQLINLILEQQEEIRMLKIQLETVHNAARDWMRMAIKS